MKEGSLRSALSHGLSPARDSQPPHFALVRILLQAVHARLRKITIPSFRATPAQLYFLISTAQLSFWACQKQ